LSLNLKPAMQKACESKRDSLTVEKWQYQVEQYPELKQVNDQGTPVDDVKKIMYASSLFKQTAVTWWYMLV
jgi:hypothetical protein